MYNVKVELVLPIKPMSVNAYTYGSKKWKTKDARDYERTFNELLEPYAQPLARMAEMWRECYGTFKVDVTTVHPASVLYTKQGKISSYSFDVDNVLKPILDMVFRFMGVNDKHVTVLVSSKVPGDSFEVRVTLELNSQS
jgi:Holliday junction resolvase RusA-like endonuclease